jgi:c(7)-type cytochrome triheme protein
MYMKRLFVITVVMICILVPMSVFSQKVGGGDVTFTPKNAGPVRFSHEKHVSEKGLRCSNCHYQLFQMSQGSYKMDMSKLTKGDFCGKCHNGKRAFDVSDQKNCSRCHR